MFVENIAELEVALKRLRPQIVMLQETWLDASTESPRIEGYRIISRRDRSASPNRGGILTLVRNDSNALAHKDNCESEERSWHFLNLDAEVILLGNWYRPGAAMHDEFQNLQEEVGNAAAHVTGIILAGDLNILHRRWLLQFSNGHTPVGVDMTMACDKFGLLQMVKEPTRGEYLLDLFISDMSCTVGTESSIADHEASLGSVPFVNPITLSIIREVWMLQNAKWPELEKELQEVNWQSLNRGTAEDALHYFMEILLICLHK